MKEIQEIKLESLNNESIEDLKIKYEMLEKEFQEMKEADDESLDIAQDEIIELNEKITNLEKELLSIYRSIYNY